MNMKISELKTIECEFIPDILENGFIYVSRKYQTAIHLCACGCGEHTVTPFNVSHGWTLTDDAAGITLNPSIGNQNFNCKSHYYVTNGKIVNC